ncbi:MAG: hypothetical protein H0U60_13255 [Blastocatellia bacterium]|nr:hypothetical protein [Blastocatellia bacterium]
MKITLWIVAEHPYGKHPFLMATATYCFDTLDDAQAFLDFQSRDPERKLCYHFPLPAPEADYGWYSHEQGTA